MLKDELLQLSSLPLTLIQDAVVVDGACSSLDRDVRAHVKVELPRVRATCLNECTWKRVAVAVTPLREEANVVALAGNHDRELWDNAAAKRSKVLLHVVDLFFEHILVLAFRDTVADI